MTERYDGGSINISHGHNVSVSQSLGIVAFHTKIYYLRRLGARGKAVLIIRV